MVLWLKQKWDAYHTLTYWSNVAPSSIKVMDLIFWEDTIVLLELAFTEPGFMTMSDGIIFQCCYMTSIHAFWLNIPRSCLKWKAVQDIVIYKWGSFPLSLSRWHGQWHASLVFFSGLFFSTTPCPPPPLSQEESTYHRNLFMPVCVCAYMWRWAPICHAAVTSSVLHV